MHNISKLWSRLLVWLNDCGSPVEANPALLFDADLPPYHPTCD